MGVFSKSKKAKELDYYIPEDVQESSMSKMSKSLKRKPKATAVQKPEINLTTALPDTNDFRTSLLMPQLSARFSMLREQDDPNTKVGKANDDSVLFPKRASRMNLFAHNPLTDIAEVESIHTTIRPPFARGERSYSLSDGYASDDGGSIMSRSKTGEGNNLFGGRQKMYRVPAGGESAKTLTDGESRGSGLGKHMYEDDVSMSQYQKYRQQVQEEGRPDSSTTDENEGTDAVNSPMTAFSKNRGTTSSTTSGPSNRRTSTAATSVTSESPIPRQNSHGFANKTRTSESVNGSDESLVKRNPSSESRRNFALRDGAQPPVPSLNKTLSQSRSAVNLNDKYSRPGMFTTSAFRAVSPPPSSNAQAIASLDLGLQDANQRVASPTRRYNTSSPSSPSPVEDEADHVYSSNLQPNDRGKATAMGLFNRPQQQFDEQQFLQRQRQMLEGRSSPFPAESRSESRASPEPISAMGRIDAALANDHESSTSVGQTIPNSINANSSPQPKGLRKFTTPNKTDHSANRPRNQSSASSTTGTGVKARVESLIRRQNAELAALEIERSVVTDSYSGRKVSQGSETHDPSSRGTFLNTFDASEDEGERSPPRESQPRLTPADIHPALRDGTHDFDFGDSVSLTPRINYRQSDASNMSNSRSINDTNLVRDSTRQPSQPKGGDSPTLGPNGLGLSGMIRSHLRHDSDRSSIYPPSPGVANLSQREVSMASTTHTIDPPESVHSDPWEFDSASRNQKSQPQSRVPSDATPTMSLKAQQILGHAQRQAATSKAQQILGHEAPNGSAESVGSRSWQDELATHHRRGESTETQKERRDFDRDLAERQRKIQERLKGVAEQDLRSRSPVGRQEKPNLPAQAFQALRQKTSMGNMAPPERPNAQPKAMKMLGLSSQDEVSLRSATPTRAYEGNAYYDRPPPHHQPPQPPQRPPPPVDPSYRSGRRTPADGRPPMDPGYASGRRTPAEGRHPMDPYSNGRRTPAEGRPPMDPGYSTGRRTPAEGRPPPPHPNGSYEDFERQRQRSATPNSNGPRRDRANSSAVEGPRSRQGHYRDEYGYPPINERQGQSPSPPEMRSRRGAPTPDPYDRSPSAMSSRQRNGSRPPHPGYYDNRIPPSQSPMVTQTNLPPGGGPPRPSPRPPMSPFQAQGAAPSAPFANPNSTSNSAVSSPVMSTHMAFDERINPQPRRDRKKSVTRGMISEPMFVSSTSSVPLVDLPAGAPSPRPNPIASPPVPAMNPRRRGNTNDAYGGSYSAQPSPSLPMSPIPANESHQHASQYAHPSQYASAAAQYAYSESSQPTYVDHGPPGKPPPRARNRLRKISSEGGNMASRARQQAFMAEMGREKENSPRVPMFPNRSATSLGMAERDGGMF